MGDDMAKALHQRMGALEFSFNSPQAMLQHTLGNGRPSTAQMFLAIHAKQKIPASALLAAATSRAHETAALQGRRHRERHHEGAAKDHFRTFAHRHPDSFDADINSEHHGLGIERIFFPAFGGYLGRNHLAWGRVVGYFKSRSKPVGPSGIVGREQRLKPTTLQRAFRRPFFFVRSRVITPDLRLTSENREEVSGKFSRHTSLWWLLTTCFHTDLPTRERV